MKKSELLKRMQHIGLQVPSVGTGLNGRVTNEDLANCIAQYNYDNTKHRQPKNLARRMQISPMLAARMDQLTEESQAEILNSEHWVAEEKYDGVRVMLFYDPEEGFSAFGRNREKLTQLPMDYSEKLLIGGKAGHTYKGRYNIWFVLDTEVTTDGFVENAHGNFSGTGLGAVVATLNSDIAASHLAQRTTAPLTINAFDYLDRTFMDMVYVDRRRCLQDIVERLGSAISVSVIAESNKLQFAQGIIARGGEGVILKHKRAPYFPGERPIHAQLKLKRTLVAQKGHDIDAYIDGGSVTPEWSKAGLIGAVNLYVRLLDEQGNQTSAHHIATVSSMPLHIRELLSHREGDKITVNPEYIGAVVIVDGQDITSKNQRIAHARVNWNIGFRKDKNAEDCTLTEEFLYGQIF